MINKSEKCLEIFFKLHEENKGVRIWKLFSFGRCGFIFKVLVYNFEA